MTTGLALWLSAAALTLFWNIYVQLVIADNWPPTQYRRISLECVFMLATICFFIWPGVLICMWIDDTRRDFCKALERNRKLKKAFEVVK